MTTHEIIGTKMTTDYKSQGDIHTSKISRCLGLWLAIKKNMVTIRFGGPSNEKGCESETFLTLIWRPSRPTSKIQVFDLNTSDQTLLSIPFLYWSPVFLQCDLASVALSWLVGFWQRQFKLNTLGIFCHIHTIQTLCIMESLLCCVLEKNYTARKGKKVFDFQLKQSNLGEMLKASKNSLLAWFSRLMK